MGPGSMMKKIAIVALIFCLAGTVAADYYDILGVAKDAKKRQINSAYRRLAKIWHPDKHPAETKEEAQTKYQEITKAYEVLKDPQARRTYDQEGEEGLKRQKNQGGGNSGWGDIFSNFGFGGGFGNRQPSEVVGESLTVDLQVTLKDLYVGKTVIVTHNKQVLCSVCRGTGAEDPDDVQQCPVCKGSGVKTVVKRLGPGFMTQTQTTCPKCNGKGKIMKSKCPSCGGTKVSTDEEAITIVVEKGMHAGHEIRFEQEADQNPGEIPGDLVFRLTVPLNRKFTRKGNDLYYKGSITLLESLVGFTKHIKHLDGHTVVLQRSDVTKPGFVMVIQNEGMPIHEQDSFGDLYVEFSVRFPATITEEQKQGFKALL
eukprot:TRINITY_DN6837_c0_g1_i2.p1 TRINITY_DN6837_c0_g1~~TRINITY_DN6837_c0_g1_i2.p1  ORF type:complete len:370 (-),score=62.31 TRINITY_DN6837_c0_g1_i2:151-1260(-)